MHVQYQRETESSGVRLVHSLTFMVLIASYASSIVSTGIHSVVCGSRSWFMISIFSPDVRIDDIPSAAMLITRL